MSDFVAWSGLAFVASLLTVTGFAHLFRPSNLATSLVGHGIVPLPMVRMTVMVVTVIEVGTGLIALASLITGSRVLLTISFVAASVVGLSFSLYLRRLLSRDYQGSCGCTPLEGPLTPASFVPPVSLAVTGLLGLGVAVPSGPQLDVGLGWTVLAAAWGLIVAGLAILLPATAPGTVWPSVEVAP